MEEYEPDEGSEEGAWDVPDMQRPQRMWVTLLADS